MSESRPSLLTDLVSEDSLTDDDDDDPFFFVSELPHSLGVEESRRATREADLSTFQPLWNGESEEQRARRLDAYTATWDSLERRLKEVNAAATAKTFEELAEYATQRHYGQHRSPQPGGLRALPTALAVAGSITAGDHAETFKCLTSGLRARGFYAALLGSEELSAGSSLAPALSSVFRQFSGIKDSTASDMQALLAWYSDELSSPDGLQVPMGVESIISPMKRAQLVTPRKPAGRVTRSCEQEVGQSEKVGDCQAPESESILSPMKRLQMVTPRKPHGRVTRLKEQHQQQQSNKYQAEPLESSKLSPALRPLVVVIESFESLDPELLLTLIHTLQKDHASLPVILVLGMSTSADALSQVISPAAVTELLAPKTFPMVQALPRLELVFRDVLLEDEHALFYGSDLLSELDDQFMLHKFTVSSFERGLKLACFHHFLNNDLSFLAATPADEMETVIGELDKGTHKRLLKALGLPNGSRAAPQRIEDMIVAGSVWKLAVLWINSVAQSLGFKADADGFSLRELCREASSPSFSDSDVCAKLKSTKCLRTLQNLPVEKGREMLQSLLCLSEGRKCKTLISDRLQKAESLIKRSTSPLEQAENFNPNDVVPRVESNRGASTFGSPSKRHSHSRALNAAERKQAFSKAVQESRAAQEKADALKRPDGSLGNEIWEILQQAVADLENPPSNQPGAEAFLVRDENEDVKRGITVDLRGAYDTFLSHPETYLGGESVGLSPQQHDTANVYQLLCQYGEEVDCEAWFLDFAAIYQCNKPDQAENPPKAGTLKKASSRRGPRGSRKGLDLATRKAAPKAARRTKQAMQTGPSGTGQALPGYAVPLEQLAASFTIATNELQVLGMVKPSSKEGHAKRLAWSMRSNYVE